MSSPSSSSSVDTPAREVAASWRGGLIVFLASLCFSYAFLQRVAPSAMVGDLMQSFGVGAAVLGNLSAIYFYAYSGLQIPVGSFLDRWGPRRMLTGSIALAGVGSLIFSAANSVELAYLGRLLVGIGSAVGLLGTLALAARWFPPRRFALLSGLAMLMGMVGGFAGQGPFAAMVAQFGWRACLFAAALFAFALSVILWLVVRDEPAGSRAGSPSQPKGIWSGLREAVSNREVWALAVIISACSGPMLAFGGLWGVPYLVGRYGLPRPDAAFYASLALVGWAVGAPICGWLSDAVGRRKPMLVVAITANLLLLLVLFYTADWPVWAAGLIIFGIGFTGGGGVTTYAYCREVSAPQIHGAAIGVVNMMAVAAGAVLQPVIGIVLDLLWDGSMEAGIRTYSQAMYETAFVSICLYMSLGLAALCFIRETYCRPQG
ncbi:MAG: MFS transporter [Pseudomonadota bacterium]